MFKKYQHIERFGTTEVEGIETGTCYIFPKIDGTNGSVWFENNTVYAGSRNRVLTLENDNAGFFNYIINDKRIENYLKTNPTHRLFGEWLCPHSLKTYKPDSWRKFYIFDVAIGENDILQYLPFGLYQPLLEEFNLNYILPISIIQNGIYEQFINQLANNTFLIEDGKGTGEGIVIKNYDFKNKYGRTTWAKIITNEFKEKHIKEMGIAEIKGRQTIELGIVNKYVTESLIDKVFAKIKLETGWNSKQIPQLLNTVFYDLVKEESWNFIKENKMPIVDFKVLQRLTFQKIKEIAPQLF